MKVNKRSPVVVIVALVAVLALQSATRTQGPVTDESTSGPANWSALSKVDTFTKNLLIV